MKPDPIDPASGHSSRLLAGTLAFVLYVVGFSFLFYASTRRNVPVGLVGCFGIYWGFRFMRIWRTGGK